MFFFHGLFLLFSPKHKTKAALKKIVRFAKYLQEYLIETKFMNIFQTFSNSHHSMIL